MLPWPYGIQQITEAPISNSSVLPYSLTSTNNQIQSSRVIDPVSQDYILNSDGTFQGQSAVHTSVYLALFTTFNSSAVYGLGNQLKLIKVITPNINKQVFNIIQQALRPLISQGVVSLLGCTIQNNGNGNISVTVSFQDLTINNANQPIQTINLPFKQG